MSSRCACTCCALSILAVATRLRRVPRSELSGEARRNWRASLRKEVAAPALHVCAANSALLTEALAAVAQQAAVVRLDADSLEMAALPRDLVVAVGDARAACVEPFALIPANMVTGNDHPRDRNTRNLRDHRTRALCDMPAVPTCSVGCCPPCGGGLVRD